MGENQGMIWIILGVVVIAGAIMFLGSTMTSGVESTTAKIESNL